MTRCRHCQSKAELRNGLCSVCGIDPEKKGTELSPEEKKVRFHAHGIRLVAMFHLIGAALAVLVMPEFDANFAIALLTVVNTLLAYGLVRYSLLAYKAATTFYFFMGMVGVISIQKGAIYIGWIALALIALYLIGNGTSKALFERNLPEAL